MDLLLRYLAFWLYFVTFAKALLTGLAPESADSINSGVGVIVTVFLVGYFIASIKIWQWPMEARHHFKASFIALANTLLGLLFVSTLYASIAGSFNEVIDGLTFAVVCGYSVVLLLIAGREWISPLGRIRGFWFSYMMLMQFMSVTLAAFSLWVSVIGCMALTVWALVRSRNDSTVPA